jgi:iron complex outermembrane receptor protein
VENDFIPADSEAVFFNAGWHITDKLELNAGTRYTTESKTFIFGRLGVPGNTYPGGIAPQVASLNNAQGKYKGDNVDYRAALQYQWTGGFMTYGSFATGFKGGGINPRPFFTDQVKPFGPEKLKAYEIGFKASLFDHRMRLNGSGFLSEYSEIQIGVNNCAAIAPAHPLPCIAPINAGDAELKGFELETEVVPTDNLQLDASLSYLNFKYTRLSSVALGTGITTGMTTPFAPEWKYSIGAQYKIDAGAAGSLTPRLDWSYQSSLYTGAVNMPFNHLPGHSELNGRLSWIPTDSLWEISLSVTNITNKLYYLGLFDNRGSSQTTEGEPAPPREWALTIKRSF